MADKIYRLGENNKGPRGGELVLFFCPGCKENHPYEINAPGGAGWTWNGSHDKPTFSPSLLVFGTIPEKRCHLFVTEGMIQFCGDSHHELAGKTVQMEDWE